MCSYIPPAFRSNPLQLLTHRDVDDVHNLMDEVAEQQEIASEISDAISNPVGFGNDVDEVGSESEADDADINWNPLCFSVVVHASVHVTVYMLVCCNSTSLTK